MPNRRRNERVKGLQIYCSPSKPIDGMLLKLWQACLDYDRPQDVFRRALLRGLIEMHKEHELPPDVVRKCPELDAFVDQAIRHRPAARVQEPAAGRVQETAPEPFVPPPSAPRVRDAPVEEPPLAEALAGLMGKRRKASVTQ